MSASPDQPSDDPEVAEQADTDQEPTRLSGDAVLSAAIERNAGPTGTSALNIGDTPPLPIDADTANVRLGPPLDDANLALLPLVGVWRGQGAIRDPATGEESPFGQQLTISHDGRGMLRHESISWSIAADGTAAPGEREIGWWRCQPDDTVEFVVASADGVMSVFYGRADSLSSWSLGTDAVLRTTSAPSITGATRLYGIVEGKLAYVLEQASTDHPLQPHASALLERVAG